MIEPTRIRVLNEKPEVAGRYVVYWMQQSQREARVQPAFASCSTDRNGWTLCKEDYV